MGAATSHTERAGTHLSAWPFVLAIGVALTVALSAPYVAQLRSWIRDEFPGRFVLIVGALAGVLLLAALAAAAARIRDNRARRYGLIGVAIVVAAGYSFFNPADTPESSAVERFHFLEYGLITFLFYRAWRPLGDLSILLLPMFAGLIVGTVEEWFQWFIPARVGELRDIFLNLAAIVSGLLFSLGVEPPRHFQPVLGRASVPRVCRMAAATLVALGAFVHALHLGYTITDSEAGSFTSRYSVATLGALQTEKAAHWRTDPPPLVLKRLSREDQYLSEGLAHVRWRNKRWQAGDISGAWQENLILEKYFIPVLDTATYEGRQGHRWPAEQRADAELRASLQGGASGAAYVSGAYPYRIFMWNKAAFWGVIGAFVIGLLALGARVSRRPAL